MGLYSYGEWDSNPGYTGYTNPNDNQDKELRKGLYSKIILILVIVTVLCYTSAVLCISNTGGIVPDSLTYCFYAFFGTEVISLVTIKVVKVKGDDKDAIYRNNRINAPEEFEEYLRGDEEEVSETNTTIQD